MVNLKVGDTVCVVKTGTGKNGRWVFAKATSESGKDTIQVWADNADSIPDGVIGCEVVAINQVTKTAHQYPENSGKWIADTKVNATLKPLGEMDNPLDGISGFSQISKDEIPF